LDATTRRTLPRGRRILGRCRRARHGQQGRCAGEVGRGAV